jgi:hypothetical protein
MRTLLLVGEGVGLEGLLIKGRRRGTRKRERPREPSFCEPVRARATEIWLSVALENHFTPFKVYWGPNLCGIPVDDAIVSVRDTSEPPGRCHIVSLEFMNFVMKSRPTSVIHCPEVKAKSGSRLEYALAEELGQ